MANPNKSYVVRHNPDNEINYKMAYKKDKTKFLSQAALTKPLYTHTIKSKHSGPSTEQESSYSSGK